MIDLRYSSIEGFTTKMNHCSTNGTLVERLQTVQANKVIKIELLAKRVREKRGERSLRDISSELGIGIATLSRIESGKLPDLVNFGIVTNWLGDNQAMYFHTDEHSSDSLQIQLRAAQKMSAETAAAFADIIRAAYQQALDAASEDEKA